jgi:hypothetical protein
VRISATDAGGNAVAVASWYQGVFNYCGVSPKPSGCPSGTHTDVPVWNNIDTLTGRGSDTSGASGWFRPTQSIKTLTFTFEKLSGFPIFQTWFAADEPAPSPTPEPQEPTEPVVLPQVIANPGTTVIVEGPIETNAGNTVKVTVKCKTYVRSGDRATPRGDYELCTVRKYAKRGKVTLTTYGNPVKVVVNLNAPATDGYTAYKKKKTYNVR